MTSIADQAVKQTNKTPLMSKPEQPEINPSEVRKAAQGKAFELLLIYQDELHATFQEGLKLIHGSLVPTVEVESKADFFNRLRSAAPLNSGQNLQLGGSKPKSLPSA